MKRTISKKVIQQPIVEINITLTMASHEAAMLLAVLPKEDITRTGWSQHYIQRVNNFLSELRANLEIEEE